MPEAEVTDYQMPGEFYYRGIAYPCYHKGIDLDMMANWKVEPTDVMIATYPKSGTTWMTGLLPKIVDEASGKEDTALEFLDRVPYLETKSLTAPKGIECLPNMKHPKLVKTHLPYEYFEEKVEVEKLKVIVVARNPRDVITSFFHLYKQKFFNYPGDIHEFFNLVKAKRLGGGDVFDWNADWWKRTCMPNVLGVKYEEMKEDCAAVVRRIADFLNLELSDEAVARVVSACAFGNMKKSMKFDGDFLKGDDGQSVLPSKEFFRKGEVGDWKNHLNEEEVKYIDKMCDKILKPVGLTF